MSKDNTSETFLFSSVLALSGGFQDAYTYYTRNQVFSNAQTGNVVLFSQNLMSLNIQKAISYLIPIIAFALGIIVADQLYYRFKDKRVIYWKRIVLVLEIITLFVVGFIPKDSDRIATMLVSFSCAMQVQAFRKMDGYQYASTMCIGNLRSGTEALSIFLRTRKREDIKKVCYYYGIIFVFAIGAGLGGVLSVKLGIKAIWLTEIFLISAFILMKREEDTK